MRHHERNCRPIMIRGLSPLQYLFIGVHLAYEVKGLHACLLAYDRMQGFRISNVNHLLEPRGMSEVRYYKVHGSIMSLANGSAGCGGGKGPGGDRWALVKKTATMVRGEGGLRYGIYIYIYRERERERGGLAVG